MFNFFRFSPLIPIIPFAVAAWDTTLPFPNGGASGASTAYPAFANPASAGFAQDSRTSLAWLESDPNKGDARRLWSLGRQDGNFGLGLRYWEGGGPYATRADLAWGGTFLGLFSPGIRPAYVWDGSGPDHFLADAGLDFRPLPQFLIGYWMESLISAGPEKRVNHLAAAVRPFAGSHGGLGDLNFGVGMEAAKGNGRHGYLFGQLPLFAGLRVETEWDPKRRQGSLGVTLQASSRWAASLGAGKSGGRQRAAAVEFRTAQKNPFLFSGGTVARLDLNRTISEGESGTGWTGNGGGIGFVDLARRFDVLDADPRLKAVLVSLGEARCGWAIGEEIRGRIYRLRARGIRVVAYMDQVTPMNYFLASAADAIAMQPQGHFAVTGFSAEVMFYRGLFDKLGVEPQFLRHGKYKSFEEPYTRTSMSAPMRADLESFLASLWENYLNAVSAARNIPKDTLRAVLAKGEISLAHAVKAHLIDTLIYQDQAVELAGGKGAAVDRGVPLGNARVTWEIPPRIALVVVQGDMVLGASARSWLAGPDLAGSETVAGQLRRARLDPAVKAVVLRVDSPGGSAQAADIMWREVELLKKAGKPVVASVGHDAASGGYYLICGADRILAEPNSVVGSIGVLWGKFVIKGLYQKLGLNTETVKTSGHADAASMARAWDSSEVDVLQRHMDQFYADFISKVAAGRHKTTAEVDSLGQGRIFTGTQGLENGLVDRLGGLEDAVAEARKLAGIMPGRDAEVATFSALGEAGVLPILNRDWAHAESGLEGMLRAFKTEGRRLEGLTHADLWAISPELAGWGSLPELDRE